MIPDFQTLMLPLLKLISDGKEYKMRTVEEILAEQFNLTKEELVELLPSGTDYIFKNRIGWAKTYLKKAGLIDSYKRGCITISEKGKVIIDSNPPIINVKFLKQFPDFLAFQIPQKKEAVEIEQEIGEETKQQKSRRTN